MKRFEAKTLQGQPTAFYMVDWGLRTCVGNDGSPYEGYVSTFARGDKLVDSIAAKDLCDLALASDVERGAALILRELADNAALEYLGIDPATINYEYTCPFGGRA